MIPVAILCGGKGTRAGLPLNKCFVDVNGKPMILRIMEQLEAQQFSTFVLCRGNSGILTALREALPQLGKQFLVLYGDTYLPLDYHDFIKQWDKSGMPMATAVRDGVDAGVNGFTNNYFAGYAADLSDLQSQLRERTFFYEAPEPWHEVGTPEALEETRRWFA